MNDFLNYANDLGWCCYTSDKREDEVCVELEKFSPMGQDFIATLWFENDNEDDFIDKLKDYWLNFDPDEETARWIDDMGHGINGAPYNLQDVLIDMEDCKEMLRDLYIAFHNKAYPDSKIGIGEGLLSLETASGISDDEQRAVYNILTSIENIQAFASDLPNGGDNDYLRQDIEEMAERFKGKVTNRIKAGLFELA